MARGNGQVAISCLGGIILVEGDESRIFAIGASSRELAVEPFPLRKHLRAHSGVGSGHGETVAAEHFRAHAINNDLVC